ncbi:hypothetical protein A0H81_07959 [Grifola frondosa]|uniref:Uncharacterized protein n=1 Tax=Grifola frondosa TaxID=5627 RepID=A0A1C7M7M3_GRIFR|nr:hypothetical protein A0H81_07959 [Grifola frondosa]
MMSSARAYSEGAWKALSHKFHGKGSGKMKTEKRLKKIAEERKKEAMASGDTPLSMNQAFQIRQEKAGQAHFVLSVGNRGAVPQAAEFLDAQPLTKGKTEKKNKKKNAEKNAAPQLSIPFWRRFDEQWLTRSASRVLRISASEVETPKGGTPVPTDRTKVVIGLGMKRKATTEAQDSPPSKRR